MYGGGEGVLKFRERLPGGNANVLQSCGFVLAVLF